MLEVRDLCKHFGGVRAVDRCSFTVERGTIAGLIGPNGAGKTTAFNCIAKTLAPTSGEVWLDGERIDRLAAHEIARRGLARTFQISRALPDLTVLENVIVHARTPSLWRYLGPAMTRKERERALALLDALGLSRLADEPARSLSYGQRKLMDFAALMMSEPGIILLDEPAGGVNPRLLEDIVARIRALNRQGLTVFIVEHNMDLVMSLCSRVIVMAHGQVIACGAPREIQADPAVLEAYLGGAADAESGAGHA